MRHTEAIAGQGLVEKCGLDKGSAATAALASSAAVTMIGNADRNVLQPCLQYFTDVQFLKIIGITNVHFEHLVEIAIVDITLPVDAELVNAHQALHVSYAESILEQVHVIFEFTLGKQGAAKASNWHVGNGEQVVELDIEFFREKCFIVPLQAVLGWWQIRSGGVVNQS